MYRMRDESIPERASQRSLKEALLATSQIYLIMRKIVRLDTGHIRGSGSLGASWEGHLSLCETVVVLLVVYTNEVGYIRRYLI
jgi:hypothetical protein